MSWWWPGIVILFEVWLAYVVQSTRYTKNETKLFNGHISKDQNMAAVMWRQCGSYIIHKIVIN